MNQFELEDLDPAEVLTYRHEFSATPEEIYGAFLDPTLFVQWFGPKEWKVIPSTLTLEPVTGGRQQFVMRHTVNPKYQAPMYMRFIEMKEPSLIEYREALHTPQGKPSDTLVGLRISIESGTAVTEDGVGEGTIVTLTQGPLPEAAQEHSRESWVGSFESLSALLKKA